MKKLVTAVSLFSAMVGAQANDQFANDRIIVTIPKTAKAANISSIAKSAINMKGKDVIKVRSITSNTFVYQLNGSMTDEEIQHLVSQLNVGGQIASIDGIAQHSSIPNDPRYPEQVYLQSGGYGLHIEGAWDITEGSSDVVVAVLDTGITEHPDIDLAQILPGYDFVSYIYGDHDNEQTDETSGRDPNPSDPGDWRSGSSSWHGTHIIGTVAAATNNSIGVAGINKHVKILPVRVLGPGGGYYSDIADGIRWAAGLHVEGIPDNQNPADILNLSLSGTGSCDLVPTLRDAINEVVMNTNVIIIAAAGNQSANTSQSVPVSCDGVIGVGSSDSYGGSFSSFSNYGMFVDFSAAGTSVLSTSNSGLTIPETPSYKYYSGTSMATANVSGVISLMKSVNPLLTYNDIMAMIPSIVMPFSIDCTGCGSGILNAHYALLATVGQPIITPTPAPEPTPVENNDSTGGSSSGGSNSGGGGSGSFDVIFILLCLARLFSSRIKKSPQ